MSGTGIECQGLEENVRDWNRMSGTGIECIRETGIECLGLGILD